MLSFSLKKPQKILVFVVVTLAIVIFLITFLQLKIQKKNHRQLSSKLDEARQHFSTSYPFNKVMAEGVSDYYEMYCQMFLSDIQVDRIEFENFIVYSYAPCFYHNSQSEIRKINLPLLIKNENSNKIIQMNSLPIENMWNLENIEIVKNLSQLNFYDPTLDQYTPSILVHFFFGNEQLPLTEEESMTNFLNPLLSQINQSLLIQELLSDKIINTDSQKVFFYQYAEKELLE